MVKRFIVIVMTAWGMAALAREFPSKPLRIVVE